MKILVLSWFISLFMTTTPLRRSRNLTVQLLHLLCKPVSKTTTSNSLENKEIKIQPELKPECQMLLLTEPLELWHWSREYISKDIVWFLGWISCRYC